MKKITKRLLVFFIGLPLVLFVVYFTELNHVLLNLVILVVSGIAAKELLPIVESNLKTQPKGLIIPLSLLTPSVSLICCTFKLPTYLITIAYSLALIISMGYEVFRPGQDVIGLFEHSASRISASVLIITYSGFFFSFLSRMSLWNHSRIFLSLFLLMVYGCDSFAWFFGMLFGKRNRGFIKASPNKSIAGFIGGCLTSIAFGIVAYYFYPHIFISIWRVILLGLFTSIAAILGDLIESVFKRSASFKDSGQVIPGRGGILDSIDSLLIAAPVFYFLVTILFGIK